MAKQASPNQPTIVSNNVAVRVAVDPKVAGRTMEALKISPSTIKNTAIFIEGKNQLTTDGITYPNLLGRIRYYFARPELRSAKGPIVRISSKVQGKEVRDEKMNRILVHELEHVAQLDRHDRNRIIGHTMVWGLAMVGSILGYWLGKGGIAVHMVRALIFAGVGHQIGYKFAPQEKQARARAKSIKTTAIKRKS